MNDLNFFDANCTLGRHLKLKEGGLHAADDLLAGMDHYGIAEALVLDSLSRENHPADGNARIMDAVHERRRLHPAWSALPHGAWSSARTSRTCRLRGGSGRSCLRGSARVKSA